MRLALAVSAVSAASPASAADFVRKPFGTMPNGAAVEAITLTGGRTTATIITLGVTLQGLTLPNRTGRIADVVLG